MANLTTNLNYLQPTSYKLSIDRENYPNLEYFCQSVNHPGMTANITEIPFRKLAGVPVSAASLTFTDFTATIILDEDMQSYSEMYNWIRRIVDNKEVRAIDGDASAPPTYCDITLSVLSSANNITKQIKYYECTPVSLGDINFESTASGTEFITFPITFRFTYFELV